jgi:hypothetical protein
MSDDLDCTDGMGALCSPDPQVAAINTAMSALVKTLNVFPKERSIVARERTRKAYNVLPYLSGTAVVCFRG